MDIVHEVIFFIAKHSGTKRMDMEGVGPENLIGAPPIMPWPKFADWIGMGDEPRVVESWIQRGYLPTKKIGKRQMVNVALLVRQLLEEE